MMAQCSAWGKRGGSLVSGVSRIRVIVDGKFRITITVTKG